MDARKTVELGLWVAAAYAASTLLVKHKTHCDDLEEKIRYLWSQLHTERSNVEKKSLQVEPHQQQRDAEIRKLEQRLAEEVLQVQQYKKEVCDAIEKVRTCKGKEQEMQGHLQTLEAEKARLQNAVARLQEETQKFKSRMEEILKRKREPPQPTTDKALEDQIRRLTAELERGGSYIAEGQHTVGRKVHC